jgi:dihydroorotase
MLKRAQSAAWVVRGGRVIDPFVGRDETADVFVVDGRFAQQAPQTARIVDGTGLIVCPGLADIHVHLREPGQSHKETIESGTSAAAAGGFTYVACMPNTAPALDEPERVRWVTEQTRRAGFCGVGPVAAITKGREGRELTSFSALLEAGAVAFSDDGVGVERDDVMLAAFEQAARLDALLIQHCEFHDLSAGGVMHLGAVSKRLGFPGLDPRSEEAMIERDIDLCRRTGGRYHVAHISTGRAVELVRRAKREGLPVTTEVCTHHLILTDEACKDDDPNTKMHPPLRPQSDVDACRQGLLDGTIDCIVTDHAPHAADEKAKGFLKAPAGIVGLETALGVAAKAMIESGLADWPALVRWFASGATRIIAGASHAMTPGSAASMTLIAPGAAWTVQADRFLSKSCNTPFDGWTLPAQPRAILRGDTLISKAEL